MLREVVRGVAGVTLRSAGMLTRTGEQLLRRADVGFGHWRLTPDGYRHARDVAVSRLREVLEIPDLTAAVERRHEPITAQQELDDLALRAAFRDLLERSRQLTEAEHPHPAYAAIIEQLCPDEARILELFAAHGAQPAVTVVAAPWIGRGARVLAQHVSLIGDRAGCLEPERAPIYLENLRRLGIITVDDEELVGHADYELIEVGATVSSLEEHIEKERNQRARLERRTLRLTPLGEGFCELVLQDE